MALIEQIPTRVHEHLCPNGGTDGLHVVIYADLTRTGRFGQEWLVVTDDRVRVMGADGQGLDLPLEQIVSVSADSLVGGGALSAAVDGRMVELVRYTNARERTFSRTAKFLNELVEYRRELAKGSTEKKPPEIHADEEEDNRCPRCKLLLAEGTKVCPACLRKHKVIGRLAGYFKPYVWQLMYVSVLMLAGTGLNLIPPYLPRPLMDQVLVPTEAAEAGQRIRLLGFLVLAMLLARAGHQVLGILQGRAVAWLGARLSHDLRTELYSHLQFLSLGYFDRRKIGAIVARVTQDTSSLEHALIDMVPYVAVQVLTLIGICAVLFWMNWQLTVLVLVPAPAVVVLSRAFGRRLMRLWHRFFHYRQRLNAGVNDSLSGIRVIKAFAQERKEAGRFSEHSREVFEATYLAERTWATLFPILWFVTSLGAIIVWYVGGKQVISGLVTPGTLMAFVTYLTMLYGPLQFLSRISDWLARSLTSAQQVFEVLDTQPDVREAADAVPMPRIEGRVELRNVTFGYDKHKPVVKDVSLDVAPGEMIGLVGHSGAGKSTAINLICRLYDVNEGQLLIDGVDIRRIHQQDLRRRIGVVLQDTFLFNGTILENIAYAKPEAGLEEVMIAAKAANAHDFIVSKPDGYDSVVGERGQMLSGGERQRIAIARAILHDPRILILDEATSSVDADTERQIQEAIARLVKGRTTFAIAHRLSTLRNADRLVVLKDGRIAELGTHDELLAKKGEFHRLVEIQKEMSRIKAVER